MFRMAWFAGSSTAPPAWNKPWSSTTGKGWAAAEFHVDLSRALGRACFDYLMIEEGPFISDSYQGTMDCALHNVWAVPKNDPMSYVPLIGKATSHIGIVATVTTTFYPPYMAARLGATLDHLTDGRFGFNLVTAHNDRSAQNYGLEKMLDHSLRYEMAGEWVELADLLWNSWDADAIVDDREGGMFIDPARVHLVHFEGKFFKCRGPLNTAPGPQRRPMICQAGGSDAGMAFAARHADTIISVVGGVDEARRYRRTMDELLLAAGRRPEDVRIFFSVSLVMDEVQEEAVEKQRRLDAEAGLDIERRLYEMSYVSGIDFSRFDLDEPLPPLISNASKSITEKLNNSGAPTLRALAGRPHGSGISFTGTPSNIAEEMGETMQEIGGDGYLISKLPTRRMIAEIADGLVPELQKLGLMRRDYPYPTFRENLRSF